MPTPQELRRRRLQNDYQEMQNIKGALVDWTPLRGTPPYVEEYDLVVSVRTIVGPPLTYRDSHRLLVTLPANYPAAAPLIVMQTTPGPYHPNWFSNSKWCYGTWTLEGLGHHIVRMMRTLQFDREITNPESPASNPASAYYLAHLNGDLFPCDTQRLPDPTRSRFTVLGAPKTFRIQ